MIAEGGEGGELDPNETTAKKVGDSSSIFPFALLRPANSCVQYLCKRLKIMENLTKEVAI